MPLARNAVIRGRWHPAGDVPHERAVHHTARLTASYGQDTAASRRPGCGTWSKQPWIDHAARVVQVALAGPIAQVQAGGLGVDGPLGADDKVANEETILHSAWLV